MSLNRGAVGCLAALAIVITSTACGGKAPAQVPGSSTAKPAAAIVAPTTLRQLQARLVTTADLPDGITAYINQALPSLPSQSPKPGPAPCGDLVVASALFGYRPAPTLSANASLVRKLDPSRGLNWEATESSFAYRAGQAGQVLTDMAASVDRCAGGSVKVTIPQGTVVVRVHETRLTGLGDEAIDIQIRTTVHNEKQTLPGGVTVPAGTGMVSSDAIAIRSGNCLLVIWEMGNPLSWNKYLTEATQAAWRAFRKDSR